MNLEVYELKDTSEEHTHFAFISDGKYGQIIKIVAYQNTGEDIDQKPIYNLGFGDYDLIKKVVDDKIVSDNGDMEKVLATVAKTVLIFFEYHPSAIVEVTGSTGVRTRLYQMLVNKYLMEFRRFVHIYGVNSELEQIEPFSPDKKYSRFFVINK